MDVSAFGIDNQVRRTGTPPAAQRSTRGLGRVETGFDRLLDSLTSPAPELPADGLASEFDPAQHNLNFSKHATARLESRGIELTSEDLEQMSDAVDRLADKDARESLLLMGDNAFIVGVPKRTVITAMTRQEAVGSIFTKIDSTVVVR